MIKLKVLEEIETMSEERKMKTEAMPVLMNEIGLEIDHISIKGELEDTKVIQLKGQLVREHAINEQVVIALHAKDQTGQYIHLQQYEFEYILDKALEQPIDISVVLLSEIQQNQRYELEIMLLTEQANEQWHTVQRYNIFI